MLQTSTAASRATSDETNSQRAAATSADGYVVDLLGAAQDVTLVGGKAAPLARAHAAGFRVPRGIVVTTRATSVPHDLGRWLGSIGPGPYAVRSSAVGEDSSSRSYAGQLETILGVAASDVPRAIERCRASAHAARVLSYAGAPGAVAVIVQQMLAPEVAGVAFSADPISGERNVVVIEAVRGLADRLVAGEVDAESWRCSANVRKRVRNVGESLLDDAMAARVAAAAQALERLFGAPQDIEWAVAQGELYVLQSRSITALPAEPVPIAVEVPPGDWERDDHHAILSPLGSTWFEPYPKAMAREMSRLMPIEEMRLATIGGHLYMQMVMKGGGGERVPPRWVLWLVSRILPSLRRANRDCVEMLDRETYLEVLDDWTNRGRRALAEATDALFIGDPTTLSNEQLLERIDAVLAHCAVGLSEHAKLGGPGVFALGKLALFIEDELGESPNLVLDLVAGHSAKTTELHRRIEEIVAAHADEVAEGPFPHTWGEAFDRTPRLAAALTEWLSANHLRMLHYDPKHATLGERPDLVIAIASAVYGARQSAIAGAGVPAAGETSVDATRARAREKLGTERLAEFERLVAIAQRAHGLRDENGIETVSRPAGLLRWYVRELGRRLNLASPEHAVYLKVEEHAPALRGEVADLVERIERRRGEESWAMRHRGPRRYGKPPAPMPPTDVFPRGLGTAMRIFGWMMKAETLRDEPGETDTLRGHGIGSKVVTARARVIDRPEQLVTLRHGEVLVCRITSPEWSVALGRVAAIVTNEGALLSHPAIIAREYGVTAVVGAGPATERIRTGDLVRVDPVDGTVANCTSLESTARV